MFLILVNVTMRPAAGIVGVVAHPFQGAWKSLQAATRQHWESRHIRYARIADGTTAIGRSTAAQRAEILERFKDAQRGTEGRQRQYREIVEQVIRDDEEAIRKTGAVIETPSSGTEEEPSLPPRIVSPPVESGTSHSSQDRPRSQVEDDAAFERDMELAKQLSLAEQRGYERGISTHFLDSGGAQ
ncbi:hypothetical protein H0H81_001742 [Sphagnurus paluster]|uniref:Uncharacterized protein n=1 Tax=Sphagnurus paluster TaxID=117069 RepID=A0A9P7K2U2_9AGAR|nr:hypothetical protein H0H81_001742 [Sphagnurus paluster]